MTVKELIELLHKEDPTAIVVMSRDAEGNSYSPFDSLWAGSYAAENSWRGEVGFPELTDELREEGYTEDDVLEGVPAVVLCPVN